MPDHLFIELGAVVTEVKGSSLCTVEPYCVLEPGPTYEAGNRVAVDLAESIGITLNFDDAKYDLNVTGNRPVLGPSWPGGHYEGILCVRETVVQGNAILKNAADALCASEPRCKYQVVASDAHGAIRRYHGFYATVVMRNANTVKFRIKKRSSPNDYHEITCNAGNLSEFYTDNLVDGQPLPTILNTQDSAGAVFINIDVDANAFPALALVGDQEVGKLPPTLGL